MTPETRAAIASEIEAVDIALCKILESRRELSAKLDEVNDLAYSMMSRLSKLEELVEESA